MLAVSGTLLFGFLHALLIEPIWSRLIGGLPFALLASAGITWCHYELVVHNRSRGGIVSGAAFGAAVWIALLPMTLLAAAIRAAGLRPRLGGFEAPLEFLVAAATGAVAGLALTRSLRGTLSAAACMAAVVLAMGGPIAIGVGKTQRLLFLGFLPVFIGAGALLSGLSARNPPAHPVLTASGGSSNPSLQRTPPG